MTSRVADILQVVVFAARAHTALSGRGAAVVALLPAEKNILELHHAGIREQQRRIAARHQRRAGHYAMAVLGEIIEEQFS